MAKTSTELQQNYLIKRRIKAKFYLGSVCIICNSVDNLEFDHIDPTSKVIDICSAIAKHWSWNKLLVELNKCQLLCKQCHVNKTRVDFKYDFALYDFNCPVCKKEFSRFKREINGKRTFCSRSCSASFYAGMAQR